MMATGTYSDGSTQDLTEFATWISSDRSIVEISNADGSEGEATGTGTGSATLTAAFSGVSGSTGITVTAPKLKSITISPNSPRIRAGGTLQMTATGHYSDGSTQDLTDVVYWTTIDPSVALFDYSGHHPGLVRAFRPGVVGLRATYRAETKITFATVTF